MQTNGHGRVGRSLSRMRPSQDLHGILYDLSQINVFCSSALIGLAPPFDQHYPATLLPALVPLSQPRVTDRSIMVIQDECTTCMRQQQ